MQLQIAALIATLCGAALAAPTYNSPNEKRFWPIPFPGEGTEPSIPAPPFPFPTDSGQPTEDTGFPRIWPRPPFGGGSCSESPIETLSGLEGQLPWGQGSSDQEDGEAEGVIEEDESESVIAGDTQEDVGNLS
jgi:hypothetical protein